MKAFVLISLKEGNEKNVLEQLKTNPQVQSGYILFGEWDILVEVQLNSTEDLGTFVMDKIRSREDVRLTSSLIVAGR